MFVVISAWSLLMTSYNAANYLVVDLKGEKFLVLREEVGKCLPV